MDELFSKDPKDWEYDSNPLERDVAQPYAQKFWEAGNQIVLLMFGAAFGTYVILAQSPELRNKAIDHIWFLVLLALAGNATLGYLLWRMACHEYRLTRCYSEHPGLLDAIWSAFHMRIWLMVVNLSIYICVLIWVLKSTPVGITASITLT